MDSRPIKDCPYCGETILAVAIRCKHCHADLASALVAPDEAPQIAVADGPAQSKPQPAPVGEPLPRPLQAADAPPAPSRRGLGAAIATGVLVVAGLAVALWPQLRQQPSIAAKVQTLAAATGLRGSSSAKEAAHAAAQALNAKEITKLTDLLWSDDSTVSNPDAVRQILQGWIDKFGGQSISLRQGLWNKAGGQDSEGRPQEATYFTSLPGVVIDVRLKGGRWYFYYIHDRAIQIDGTPIADTAQASEPVSPQPATPAVAVSESVPAPPSPIVAHGKWTVETQDSRYPIADVSSLIPETATKVELKAYTLRSDKPPVVVMKWRDGGYHTGVAVKGASDAWDVLAKSERDLYTVEAAELIPGSHQLVWYNIAGSGSFLDLHVLTQTDNGLESPLHVFDRGGISKVTVEGDRLWYNGTEYRNYHRWNGSKFAEQRVALSELWPANTKVVHYWLDKATQQVQFDPVKLDLRVGDLVGLVQKGDRFLEQIQPGGPLEWDENHTLKATAAGTTGISIRAKFADTRNDVRIPVHIEP